MKAKAEVRVEVEVWPNSTISQDSIVGIDRTSIGRPKGEPEAGFELSFARVDLAMTLPERSAYLSTGRPEYVIDADVRKLISNRISHETLSDGPDTSLIVRRRVASWLEAAVISVSQQIPLSRNR